MKMNLMPLIKMNFVLFRKISYSSSEYLTTILLPLIFIPLIKNKHGIESLNNLLTLLPILLSAYMIEFGYSNAKQKFNRLLISKLEVFTNHIINAGFFIICFMYFSLNDTIPLNVLIFTALKVFIDLIDFRFSAALRSIDKIEKNIIINSIFNTITASLLWITFYLYQNLIIAVTGMIIAKILSILIKSIFLPKHQAKIDKSIEWVFSKFRISHGILAINGFILLHSEKLYFGKFLPEDAARYIIFSSVAATALAIPAAAFTFALHESLNKNNLSKSTKKTFYIFNIISLIIITLIGSIYLKKVVGLVDFNPFYGFFWLTLSYYIHANIIPMYYRIISNKNVTKYALLTLVSSICFVIILNIIPYDFKVFIFLKFVFISSLITITFMENLKK